MKTYYIYHIPGVKIGCTTEIEVRMRDQGFTSWEILEEHTDGWLAGDREIELQKEYGLPVDKVHYMISVQNRRLGGIKGGATMRDSGQLQQIASLGGKAAGHKNGKKRGAINGKLPHYSQMILTYEQAEEIRTKYIPRKYSTYKLAKEYGISQNAVMQILRKDTYKKR